MGWEGEGKAGNKRKKKHQSSAKFKRFSFAQHRRRKFIMLAKVFHFTVSNM